MSLIYFDSFSEEYYLKFLEVPVFNSLKVDVSDVNMNIYVHYILIFNHPTILYAENATPLRMK